MANFHAFHHLLDPVGVEDFFETYWERRSVYIPGAGKRLPFTFSQKDFFEALPTCLMVKGAYRNAEGQHRETPITADQAAKLFDAGISICAARLENGHARIKAFLDALEDIFWQAGSFQMNGYLSPADKGFGVHFDNHSVWIIQIEGSKKWIFSDEPEVAYPLTNLIYPLKRDRFQLPWYTVPRPDVSTFNEVILEPGDVLYLPAGAWHETQASTYSLSLTLAQEPVYTSHFILDRLKSACLHKVPGRRFLPGVLTDEEQQATFETEVKAALQESLAVLREAVDTMDADRLYDIWKTQVAKKHQARHARDASAAPSTLRVVLNGNGAA